MKFINFLNESKDESFQETIKFLNVEVTFEFTKEPKYIIHSKDGIDYINNATDVINKLGLSKKLEFLRLNIIQYYLMTKVDLRLLTVN